MSISQSDDRQINRKQLNEQIQQSNKQKYTILNNQNKQKYQSNLGSFQTQLAEINNLSSHSKNTSKLKQQLLNHKSNKGLVSQQSISINLEQGTIINPGIYYKIGKIQFQTKKKFLYSIAIASVLTIAFLLYLGALIQRHIILSQIHIQTQSVIERPFKYICNSQYWLRSRIAQKFKLRDRPRASIPPILNMKTDRYDLKYSTSQIIKQTYKNTYHSFAPQNIYNYQLSMRLMQLVHNINYKGQFVMDHYNYYACPEQKYLVLSSYLQQQKRYFDQKYQIQKYRHNQIRFCIAVTSYNNAKNRIYLRNLDSIFQQEYQNYYVVYMDDISTDGTAQYVEKYMIENQIPQQKYIIVRNERKYFGGQNFYNAAHNYCKSGQVLLFLDGDDSFIGRQALALQNAIYQRQKAVLTYGQFLAVSPKPGLIYGWSRPVSAQIVRNGVFRSRPLFTNCHLKTMYVDLYRKIDIDDLRFTNGSFLRYSTDVAFMLPAIQMVQQRAIYVNEIIYEYTVGDGLNQPLQPQAYSHNFIRLNRTKKQKLTDLSFADSPQLKHYQ